MIKKLLNFINKNILLINLLLIISVFIFYMINKDKFNTYKAYLTYNFEERSLLFGDRNLNFVTDFLGDLQFSAEDYKINNLKKGTKLKIDKNDQTLNFNFVSRRSKFSNSDEKSDSENINLINNFIEDSLNIYHRNLSENLSIKKKSYEKNFKRFLLDEKNELIIEKMNQLSVETDIFDEYLNILNDGGVIIKAQGYNIKYRRLFLNLDEYLISSIILLLIFNFIIKNLKSIIK